METVTLQYNARSSLIRQLIEVLLAAGAKIVEPKSKTISQATDFDIVANYLFPNKKNRKYTEKELFLINSKINASKNFAKYL